VHDLERTWPIFVEGWQHECCGEPFAVGDRVRWDLALVAGTPGLEIAEVELGGAQVERVDWSDGGRERVDLRLGGLHVGWEGERGGERRGLLLEDHHAVSGAASTPTEGVVRRIRLVVAHYERSDERSYRPTGVPARLVDLERAPDGFASALEGDRPWLEDGLLVDLEVTPVG
jgi:hypothetical protein